MKILITYDVSKRQSEVKKELEEIGFRDYWKSNEKIYYLPYTTLWHHNLPAPTDGKKKFHEIITKLNLNQPENNKIRVERFIAVPCEIWSGIEGDPHTE